MGQANYSSAKAGLIGLTKATARELASRGITVNAVAPGFVLTELTQDLPDDAQGADHRADAARPLRHDRGDRRRRRLPRLRRGRVHHRPGARRRRRPGDDVAVPFTVERTAIPEVLVVRPRLFGDERGWFAEIVQAGAFAGLGLPDRFVQVNQSRSARGVVRGLHFQWDPPQGKLMRVVAGRAFLVAVDIRPGSPTLGRHVDARGAPPRSRVLFWAPASFARGFAALRGRAPRSSTSAPPPTTRPTSPGSAGTTRRSASHGPSRRPRCRPRTPPRCARGLARAAGIGGVRATRRAG